MAIEVRKVVLESVADASGMKSFIEEGVFGADEVIAVVGKTEGNGGVNDFTRILADRAFRDVLMELGTRPLEEVKEIPMVWSGGTDGILTPHATVFARVADDPDPSDEPRLAVGYSMSEIILPEDIGRPAMVEKVAEGVKRAMAEAGIEDPADVHYVQTKTPLLTMDTINDAKSRGHTVVTEDPLESMNISNGTSGLGIAYALGEIATVPTEDQIGHDLSLYSSVASCSSGVELNQAQTVVVGNVHGAGGRYRIGHSVMKDALDFEGVYEAIRSAGLDLPERARPADLNGRLVNVFVKCEADPTAKLRGRRQVALDDSDVHHHRHIKGAVGGVVAAAVDDAAVFVSVAAIHQGPSGGGPVARTNWRPQSYAWLIAVG